jgi:hypothetical protein
METPVIENGMWVPSSAMVLILVVAGITILSLLHLREIWMNGKSLSIRRMAHRTPKIQVPESEQLPLTTRCVDTFNLLRRDRWEVHQTVETLSEDRESYSERVRREIDRMVGRDEYQGKKEQL